MSRDNWSGGKDFTERNGVGGDNESKYKRCHRSGDKGIFSGSRLLSRMLLVVRELVSVSSLNRYGYITAQRWPRGAEMEHIWG